MKPQKSIALAVTLALSLLFTLSACGGDGGGGGGDQGGSSVAGTYTMTMSFNEFAEKSNHSGYLAYSGSEQTTSQTNTLELKADGTYSLTKHMEDTGMLIKVEYTFTGSYTADGDTVTLNAAEKCTFSEDWGNLSGYIENTEGKDSTEAEALSVFPTQFYAVSESGNANVVVKISSDGTFTYN